MRADRLLSLMLLLQANGQMTAGQLAQELHVSERTIYRDVEALSLAGIPIYTQDGRNGGIGLDEQYRVSLTGLNKQEVQALFVSGTMMPIDELGLAEANDNILLKLLASLPSLQRAEAQRIRQRIYIDPYQWFDDKPPSPFLNPIQEAVLSDAVLTLHYQRSNGEVFRRDVQAYGMVAKMNVWYLVGAHDDGFRSYRLSRIVDVQPTGETFQRDPEFKLIDYWQANAKAFVAGIPHYPVRIAVKASRQTRVSNALSLTNPTFSATDDPEWLETTINFDTLEQAVTGLIGIVCDIRILAPTELKTALLNHAREAVDCLTDDVV
jgi:predicted DNA-binding transcriptional regulator YafY